MTDKETDWSCQHAGNNATAIRAQNTSYSDLDTLKCHLAQLETCFDVRLQILQKDK